MTTSDASTTSLATGMESSPPIPTVVAFMRQSNSIPGGISNPDALHPKRIPSISAFSLVLLATCTLAPSRTSPFTMALADPPAPITSTLLPFKGHTSSMAFTAPIQSVFVPNRRPALFMMVLHAPISRAKGSISSRYAITASL